MFEFDTLYILGCPPSQQWSPGLYIYIYIFFLRLGDSKLILHFATIIGNGNNPRQISDRNSVRSVLRIYPPRKWTCHLKRDLFKRERIIFQPAFCSWSVSFLASIKYSWEYRLMKSLRYLTIYTLIFQFPIFLELGVFPIPDILAGAWERGSKNIRNWKMRVYLGYGPLPVTVESEG